MRLRPVEHPLDIASLSGVAAKQTVIAQNPQIAQSRNGHRGGIRNGVGVGEAAGAGMQQGCEFVIGEAVCGVGEAVVAGRWDSLQRTDTNFTNWHEGEF